MVARLHRSSVWGIGLCLFFTPLMGHIAKADEPCELSAAVLDSDALGYRSRGDRCEGRYVEKLTGSAIDFVSFTSAFQDYDPGLGLDLNVAWTSTAGAAMHLRARSVEPKIYYQMDTTRPTSETAFDWPVTVLNGLDLDRRRLGVLGFYVGQIGSAMKNIHVPLKISQGPDRAETSGPGLLVRPGVQLYEAYVSLKAIDVTGRVERLIQDEEALDLGFYPAERAFQVPLPLDLPRPGLYQLTLAAEARGTGNVLVEHFYFRLAL